MKKYTVGGAVRDTLMGIVPKDIDYVVIGSSPEEMVSAGYKQVGADFPVFLDPVTGEEYALARTERKTGLGYGGFETNHGKEVTLEDDLARRDLTINAMAEDEDGNIIDPFGGRKDIATKTLRHIFSHAFVEDPVRVLRLARFRARLGEWNIAISTLNLCKQMTLSGELNHLTSERVLKEMEKALTEPRPDLFFETLLEVGALEVIMPEILKDRKLDFSFYFDGTNQCDVRFRYAAVTDMMLPENVEAFENRLKVSTDWSRYAKMTRTLLDGGCCDIDSIDILYSIDAYRQKEIWGDVISDVMLSNYRENLFIRRIIQAWYITNTISFSDLTEEQRLTLKGPAISEAIRQKRRDIYSQQAHA